MISALVVSGMVLNSNSMVDTVSNPGVVPVEVSEFEARVRREIGEIEKTAAAEMRQISAQKLPAEDEARAQIAIALQTHIARKSMQFMSDHKDTWGTEGSLSRLTEAIHRLNSTSLSDSVEALETSKSALYSVILRLGNFAKRIRAGREVERKREAAGSTQSVGLDSAEVVKVCVQRAMAPVELELKICQNLLKEKIRTAELDAGQLIRCFHALNASFNERVEAHEARLGNLPDVFANRTELMQTFGENCKARGARAIQKSLVVSAT